MKEKNILIFPGTESTDLDKKALGMELHSLEHDVTNEEYEKWCLMAIELLENGREIVAKTPFERYKAGLKMLKLLRNKYHEAYSKLHDEVKKSKSSYIIEEILKNGYMTKYETDELKRLSELLL